MNAILGNVVSLEFSVLFTYKIFSKGDEDLADLFILDAEWQFLKGFFFFLREIHVGKNEISVVIKDLKYQCLFNCHYIVPLSFSEYCITALPLIGLNFTAISISHPLSKQIQRMIVLYKDKQS